MWRVFELASVGYMTGSSRCQMCFFSYLSGYFADVLTYVMECRSSSQTFRSSGLLLLCCVLLERAMITFRYGYIQLLGRKLSACGWQSRGWHQLLETKLWIRAWTEMKLSPADGHVEGGSGLSLLFGGLAAFDGVSSSRDKETQK